MMKLISILLLAILLAGCYNDRGINFPFPELNNYHNGKSGNYVPGEVACFLKDSVSLERLADTIYSYNNISINTVTGLQYTSALSPDSAATIDSVLKSRTYLNNLQVRVSYLQSGEQMLIQFGVSSFTQSDISDWNSLVVRFDLAHAPSNSQTGQLNVPTGQEQKWINSLWQTRLFIRLELEVINSTDFN